MRVKSLQTKIDALLDLVVATDRHMVRMKRHKDLEKHMASRQAVHDLFQEERDRITKAYWEERV